MFVWTKSGSGGDVTRSGLLRGVISGRLGAAAREILAAVERTVAEYEEEASGFRAEIDRQRRQLELLLQPRVQLERQDLVPDLGSHAVVVLSGDEEEEEEEEEPNSQPSVVEDTGSLGLLCYHDDDEDEQLAVQLATSSKEDLKDPDYEIPSRSLSPRKRKRSSNPRTRDPQNQVDLRVCVLEDPHTLVLSKQVKKSLVQDLRCPRGLPEDLFLVLLRSIFPQLAAGEAFDVFSCDGSKRLQPLDVKTLTPDEISRTIRSTGAGNSALYIRLKEAQSSSDELHPPRKPDNGQSSSAMMSDDQNDARLSSPGRQSDRRRRGRPRLGEELTHHVLRMCLLEDSRLDLLSEPVPRAAASRDLTCPRGLSEADFLSLLRSAFPQLDGDNKTFDIFKSDRSRRLQRLDVKTLTPEEIFRVVKLTGARKTLLYIRLKEEKGEELHLIPPIDEHPSTNAVVMKTDEAEICSSSSVHRVRGTVVVQEEDDAAEGGVDFDDDRNGDGGMDRNDHDWKPETEVRPPQVTKNEGPVARTERSKALCKVCGVWYRILGSLIKHAWSHLDESPGVCGVCGKCFESSGELKEHLKSHQRSHDCTYCGKSFFTITGLACHTSLHTGHRPYKCSVCSKTFAHQSGLRVHRWIHVGDKPHKCDICPKSFGLKAQLRAHRAVHTSRDKYQCNICGKCVSDLRSLSRHKLTHSSERRFGCEVCGKRFKLPGTLKSHEKTHRVRDRTYLCHVCCKTFVSSGGLTVHMRTHTGEKPYVCGTCGKSFVSSGELKSHGLVHSSEAPYGCSECGRFFKRKTHLNNHIRSHLGIKAFECGVCGKACARQEHLTVHMRTHNGERPYECTVCGKAFTQSHVLKTHMKSHRDGEDAVHDPSTS